MNTTTAAQQTSPDYLSMLMGGAPASFGASSVAGTSSPASTSAAPASTQPVTAASAGYTDAPMLLSQAGAPPEGYEYVVNDEGYITGITLKKTYSPASAAPTSVQTVAPSRSRTALQTALPAIAIGCVAALCAVAMIVMRRKKNKG